MANKWHDTSLNITSLSIKSGEVSYIEKPIIVDPTTYTGNSTSVTIASGIKKVIIDFSGWATVVDYTTLEAGLRNFTNETLELQGRYFSGIFTSLNCRYDLNFNKVYYDAVFLVDVET